jgi:hypothetical protein
MKAATLGATAGADNTSTVSERFIWYDKLNFVPVEKKDVVWAAQWLAYFKSNMIPLVNPEEAKKLRALERGEIDAAEYKKMIDPTIDEVGLVDERNRPIASVSKRAEYFHADWKVCPIYVHLDNILEAKIKQAPLNLYVKAADEYAMLKQQKRNAQILGRTQFTGFLNGMNKVMRYPPLAKSDDPFRYAGELKNGVKKATDSKLSAQTKKYYKQPPIGMNESLKAQIGDDPEGLALYNEFIDKDGVEIACEVGTKYYLLDKNKFLTKARKILSDIKNFNKTAMQFYTSETTGEPMTEHLPVEKVNTLSFNEDDGSDIVAWNIEWDIPFGQFIQRFGADLNASQLRDVFEANRKIHNVEDYDKASYHVRNNAKIRIGYFEFESQDMEVYANYEMFGNQKYKKEKTEFKPDPAKFKNSTRDESHYNVWRKMYYIPSLIESKLADFNVENQAKTIYQYDKLQDQQREGDDYRYSKTSLVVRQSDRMTYAEIVNSIMPKINFLWYQFQNEMVNCIPNGLYFAEELVTSMASTADGANNNNQTSKIEFMRKLKQTGWAVGKVLKDDMGKIIGDGKPFFEMKNTMLQGAMEKLDAMMVLYNMMMQSLGQNDISEGGAPKPRQNLGGIQLALTATTQSQFFIEEPYMDIVLELAKRHIYYFKQIVDEGDSKRLQAFKDIVGSASGTALEAIKDIPLHNLGLTIENAMTDDQRKSVNDLAGSLASAGILMPEDAIFIAQIDDVKYAYAILSLKAKAGRKAMADAQAAQAQAAAQATQQATQLKIEEIKAQGQNVLANTNAAKQWDMKTQQMILQLKEQMEIAVKKMTAQSNITEEITKSNIDKVNNQQPVAQSA